MASLDKIVVSGGTENRWCRQSSLAVVGDMRGALAAWHLFLLCIFRNQRIRGQVRGLLLREAVDAVSVQE